MRRTGQTFRLLMQALLTASEGKQDVIILVHYEHYGSDLINRLYTIAKNEIGDYVTKDSLIKLTLANGCTITSMTEPRYNFMDKQGKFRGRPQPMVLRDGSCFS